MVQWGLLLDIIVVFEALWVLFWLESIFCSLCLIQVADNGFGWYQYRGLSQLGFAFGILTKFWGGGSKHIITAAPSIDFNHQPISFWLSWWTFLPFRFRYMLELINLHVSHVHQECIVEIHLRYWIVTVVLAVTTSTIPSYMPAILDFSSEEKTPSHVSLTLIGLHLLNVKVRADYIILLSIRISLWQTLEVLCQQ